MRERRPRIYQQLVLPTVLLFISLSGTFDDEKGESPLESIYTPAAFSILSIGFSVTLFMDRDSRRPRTDGGSRQCWGPPGFRTP